MCIRDRFEDASDRISQDIVTAFFVNVEKEDDISVDAAENCAEAVFCEQMAFFSREVARDGGVKVANHVHSYRPTSELRSTL